MADTKDCKDGMSIAHAESTIEKGTVFPEYDMPEDEERRMVRKIDWRVLPVVSALYVMSFLNRVNIGKECQASWNRDTFAYQHDDFRKCSTISSRKRPWFDGQSIPNLCLCSLCDLRFF